MKKQLTTNELGALMFIAALVFGAWLRLNAVNMAGFPMNDGGMFFTMIQDLRHNGYILPAYTTYNNLNIPFAYPPLAFYLAGFLADVFRVSDLKILLWLPAIINIATIPAFYLLASAILETRLKAGLATLFYTLTPLAMDWLVMGGGLTRGMGQLFLILTSWGAYELFHRPSRKVLLLTILSGALVVLCHPESALLAVASAGIIWAFSTRSKETIVNALLVCAGVAVLVSPWLIAVLHIHGLEPLLKAGQTNGSQLLLWAKVLIFDFAQEPILTLLAVLGLVGLFIKISQKDYLLPVWVVLPFFINPRSSARAAILALAMLAAVSLVDVILPALAAYEAQASGKSGASSPVYSKAGFVLLGYIILYMLAGGYSLGMSMAANRLSQDDQQAMTWARDNTPPESKFVIVTGELQMLRDPVQEWFPAWTGRTSETTLQGREWLWGGKFIESVLAFQGMQNCITQDQQCVEFQAKKLELPFDYLYIKKQTMMQCPDGETCRYNSQVLVEGLEKSPQYKLVYESGSTAIFGKTKSLAP